jgi:hypothetical protein
MPFSRSWKPSDALEKSRIHKPELSFQGEVLALGCFAEALPSEGEAPTQTARLLQVLEFLVRLQGWGPHFQGGVRVLKNGI